MHNQTRSAIHAVLVVAMLSILTPGAVATVLLFAASAEVRK